MSVESPTPPAPASRGGHRLLATLLGAWILGSLYFLVTEFSFARIIPSVHFTPMWLGAGLATAALLITQRRAWPILLLAVFLADALARARMGPLLWAGLATSVIDTIEPWLAALLVSRFVNTPLRLDNLRQVLGLSVWILPACVFSAVTGPLIRWLAHLGNQDTYLAVSWMWLVNDYLGILALVPLVVTWWSFPPRLPLVSLPVQRRLEAITLYGGLSIVALLVFGWSWDAPLLQHPYWPLPFLIWAALRFGPRGAATASTLLALSALVLTVLGFGPFAAPHLSEVERTLTLQFFLIIVILSTLVLAAVLAERKQAEQSVRSSEQRFRHLVEAIHIIPWEADAQTQQFTYVGPQVVSILGYPLHEWYEHGFWHNHLHPEDRAWAPARCRALSAQQGEHQLEYRMLAADGRTVWILDAVRVLTGPDGRQLLQGFMLDITSRKQAEQAVHQSQQMLRNVLDTIPVRVFWKDRNSVFLGCNRLFAEDAGLRSPDEIVGKTDYEVAWKDQAELYRRDDAQVIQTGLSKINYEEPQTTPTGRRIWLLTSKIPLRDLNGHIIGMMGTYEDITARKMAEQAMRESEEQLRLFIEHAPAALAMFDREMRYVNVSRRWLSDYKLEGRDLRGLLHYEVFPDLPERFREAHQRGLRGEVVRAEDDLFERQDGTKQWSRWEVRPWFDAAGQIAGIVVFAEDVTARKLAQEALRESEERFREIIQHIDAVFWMMDPAGPHMLYVSPAYERVWGRSCKDLYNHYWDWASSLHPDDRPWVEEHYRTGQFGRSFEIEYRMIRPDGEVRWIRTRASPILGQDGQVRRVAGLSEDITELRAARESLRKAKEDAEAASTAKDQFIAALSHELRTPLTPVLGAISLLLADKTLPKETQDDLEMVRRNIELEARLIDDLLDVTRIARGKLELSPEVTDIHALLDHAIKTCCAEEIVTKQIQVEYHPDAAEHYVWGDPTRLEQVFWNVIQNATKFTLRNGRISIRTYNVESEGVNQSGNGENEVSCLWPQHRALAPSVVVEVSDTGVGIEPEMLPRLFSAFEQLDRWVTRRFGGLGLGLAISKAITELHHGTISAFSEGKGKGATFRIELPTISPSLLYHRPSARVQEDETPGPSRALRILLVEDHADTARTMSHLLQIEGHEVRTADTLATAMDLAGRERFDLLISDLSLPDGTGLDLMRHLRDTQPALKAIALSGHGSDEDIQRSHEAGFAEHLVKPIDLDQLHAAISLVAD